MPKTVNDSFIQFHLDIVNLLSERTSKARSSRDWLIGQLLSLPANTDDFPKLFDGMHIKYGSFARNTKIQPLDDIDLILTLSADGTTYLTVEYGKKYLLSVPAANTNLRKLCNDDGILNSRKVVNKLVSSLNNIEHYKKSEIHRKQEAATLQLNSYEWNFDIVPALYTDTGYYLIPDGDGNWKATDPRVDQKYTSETNQKLGGKALQLIRTLKYWKLYAGLSCMSSYLFENLILNFCNINSDLSDYIDYNLRYFWKYLSENIYYQVNDPKGFQGNINNLTYEEKQTITKVASDAYTKSSNAYKAEIEDKDHEKAIKIWQEIFGDKFPKYE